MTTSRQSVSRLRPSRLCRFLLCAVTLKICLAGGMLVGPFLPGGVSSPSDAKDAKPAAGRSESTSFLSPGAAYAAESPAGTAAGAAPAAVPAPQSNLSREALQRRQEELARKEQDMRTLERDLDERLIRLQELEIRLQAMLKEADEIKSAKFKHLVGVLGNMKAKQAANVLETLDENIAVKVLAGMNGRQAGEILTYVNAGKAARLAESLARMQLPFE